MDLTILCSGQEQIKCHSAIFSMVSSMAKEALKTRPENPNGHFIQLPWCSKSVVEVFLKNVYCAIEESDSSGCDQVQLRDLVEALKVSGVCFASAHNAENSLMLNKNQETMVTRHKVKKQMKFQPGSVTFVRRKEDLLIAPTTKRKMSLPEPEVTDDFFVENPADNLPRREEKTKQDDFVMVKCSVPKCTQQLNVSRRDFSLPNGKVVCSECAKNSLNLANKSKTQVMKAQIMKNRCDRCLKGFSSKDELELHKKSANDMTHRVLRQEPRKCEKCDETINSSFHTCVLNYLCPTCGATVTGTEKVIQYHKDSHMEPMKCDLCDFQTTSKPMLKGHKTKYHNEGSEHSCKRCPFKAKTWQAILLHTRRVHENCPKYPSTEKIGVDLIFTIIIPNFFH